MAKNTSIIGILINIQKAGNGDKQAIASLKGLQKGISEATAIFGTLAGVGYAVDKVFDATAGKFITYAGDVRSLSQAFSLDAEEASRLIQITDDLNISQESLTKALKTMSSHGIEPSLAGLQMLADKYKAIQDPAAKAKFLTDNFGKSGLELASALNMGRDGLQNMNDAVEKGLVLTEQALADARAYELQVDALNDTWDAFAMSIGQVVVPALNASIQHTIAAKNATEEYRKTNGWFTNEVKALNQAIEDEEKELKNEQDALIASEMVKDDLIETTDELAEAESELREEQALLKAAMSGDLKKAFDDYNDSMQELTKRSQSLLLEYQKLIEQGYAPTSEKVMEVRENMRATTDAIQDQNAQLRKSTTLMIFNNAAAHLDAKGQLALAKAFGLASIRDLEVAAAIEELTEKYQDQSGKIPTEKVEEYNRELQELRKRLLAIPPTVTSDVAVTYTYSGTPPPGGSCFLAGTRVHMADHSQRPIESVRVGEYVLTYDFTYGENVPARVREVFHHAPEETDRYLVINHDLRVTPNHRVYTSEGWKSAGDLRIGHEMILRSGEPYIVEQIDVVERRVAVYNLHVDHPDHNYYANEILVHNVKTDDSEGYAFGGVAQGPESGHWELLHGTELVMRPSQFASLLKMAAGQRSAGGGGMGVSFAGATFNVSLSGASSIGEFYQTIMDSAGRNL